MRQSATSSELGWVAGVETSALSTETEPPNRLQGCRDRYNRNNTLTRSTLCDDGTSGWGEFAQGSRFPVTTRRKISHLSRGGVQSCAHRSHSTTALTTTDLTGVAVMAMPRHPDESEHPIHHEMALASIVEDAH